jgi:DNA-binding SARP family transcriptional activator
MTQPIRISVLGGFTLEIDGVNRTASVQRKLAAVLAVLAISRERGIGRDRLVDLIWPDADVDRARHALTQSLYAIRRTLGDAAAIVGSSQVALNADVVATDIEALERALSDGDHRLVLELWRGVPLEGVTTGASEELERWLDEARGRYRQRLTAFLDSSGKSLIETGDTAAAVLLFRRRASLDPLDAVGAMALMRALAAAGDTPGALQHQRLYADLVRHELELEPDPRVATLGAELEQARQAVASPPVQPDPGPGAPALQGVRGRLRSLWRSAFDARRLRWWRVLVRRAAYTSTAAVVVMLAVARYGTVQQERALNPLAVSVIPFRVDGVAPELRFLRTGLVDLLSVAFTERDTVPVTDPGRVLLAWEKEDGMRRWPSSPAMAWPAGTRRSLGSGRFVTGAVIGNAAQLIVQASLTNGVTGEVEATASAHGPLDSLPRLVARLATRLVAAAAGAAEAVHGTPDVDPEALRRYLKAVVAQRLGEDTRAQTYLAAALQADSTFAAAAVALAEVSGRTGDMAARDVALALAVRWYDRLAQRDRVQLAALLPAEACTDSGYARLAPGARLCGPPLSRED